MVPFSAFTEPFWMALDAGWFRIPRNWNKRRKTETVREKDWVSIFGVQWAKISLVTGKKAHKTCSVLNVLPYSATCSQCRHGHWKQLNSSIGIPSPKANWHFGCSSYAHHIRLKQSSNHLPSLHHINSNSYSARKRLTTNWSWISCTHMHDYEATCTAYLIHWEKKRIYVQWNQSNCCKHQLSPLLWQHPTCMDSQVQQCFPEGWKTVMEVSCFLSLDPAVNAEQPEQRQLLHWGWTHALTPPE